MKTYQITINRCCFPSYLTIFDWELTGRNGQLSKMCTAAWCGVCNFELLPEVCNSFLSRQHPHHHVRYAVLRLKKTKGNDDSDDNDDEDSGA